MKKPLASKKRRLHREFMRYPGVKMILDPSVATSVFSDAAGTSAATVTGSVRCIRDIRYRNGVSIEYTSAGTVPTLEALNPRINYLKFGASAQLSGNAGVLALSNNKAAIGLFYATTLPASGGATKRAVYFSHGGAAGSVRASSNIISGDLYQIQSRSLDADGAQTTGSVGGYTAGDTEIRIDVFDYANTEQRTLIDATEVLTAAPAWGGTSTTASNSVAAYLSGGSGSLYYENGWIGFTVVFDFLPADWQLSLWTKLAKERDGLA